MQEFLYRIPPWILIAMVAHGAILGTVAYLILLERKIASWAQDRLGPNRVGPFGLFQPIADGLKFLLKEDYQPRGVDKYLFTLAPAIMMGVIIVTIVVIPFGGTHEVSRPVKVMDAPTSGAPDGSAAVVRATTPGSPEYKHAVEEAADGVPFGGTLIARGEPYRGEDGAVYVPVTYRYAFQAAKLNVAALFVIAILSLAVYGVVLGGWASNNKYSFLGGLRATAQMVSYEIPLGVSMLCVLMMFGTLELGEIVNKQAHYWFGVIPAWNIFTQPVAFILFLVCIHAEANRAPFDLAEAEQELVGGYHTEYSSMRFALFFLAEYAGMITTSAICVALFFGGWHFPGLSGPDAANPDVTTSLGVILLRCGVYFGKVVVIIAVFMWVRWSLPRFRFDQLMMLAWRSLIPLSLGLLVMTGLVIFFFGHGRDASLRATPELAGALLIGSVAVLAINVVLAKVLPAAPPTNRKARVPGSRFNPTETPVSA